MGAEHVRNMFGTCSGTVKTLEFIHRHITNSTHSRCIKSNLITNPQKIFISSDKKLRFFLV